MNQDPFQIKLDTSQFEKDTRKLKEKLKNMKPLTASIASLMRTATIDEFETEGHGEWKPTKIRSTHSSFKKNKFTKKGDKSEKKYFSCGVLKNDIMDKLGSKTKTFIVSEETLIKNNKHIKITKDDVLELQTFLDGADYIVELKPNHFIFSNTKFDNLKMLVLKIINSKEEIFMQSFHTTSKSQLKKKYEDSNRIIKKETPMKL